MDAAMIVVLILTAGVVALLAWFEINSRRNDAKMESNSKLGESVEMPKRNDQIQDKSDTQKKTAA
jgi:hypothetical protein